MTLVPITLKARDDKKGFTTVSEYTAARLAEWIKKYKWFQVMPKAQDSTKGRRYLEGAVIPEYCKFQYSIEPRDPNRDEARRFLFKRDFNYEIVESREGSPERIPVSTVGKVNEVTQKFVEWATENGCKVPDPELFKLWRDKWKMDERFPTFHDFLTFLKLDCDAMPSKETLDTLIDKKKKKYVYPDPKDFKAPKI